MTAAIASSPLPERVLDVLVHTSAHGALLVALVWLACRAFPRMPAHVRCALWWLACARLVVGMVWVSPVALPILPAAATTCPGPCDALEAVATGRVLPAVQVSEAGPGRERDLSPATTGSHASDAARGEAAGPVGGQAVARGSGLDEGIVGTPGAGASVLTAVTAPAVALAGVRSTASDAAAVIADHWRDPRVRAVLLIAWCAGVLLLVARSAAACLRHRRVVTRARIVPPGDVPGLTGLIDRLRLRHVPDVVASSEVTSPHLTWVARPQLRDSAIRPAALGRPVIVLPESSVAAPAAPEITMVLCHELIHLRRRDLWWGAIACAAEHLFFFHPLARLAAHEYLVHREAACDAEVVRTLGAAPQDYGRLLVRFGIGRRAALAVPGAAHSFRMLKRRLIMLQHVNSEGRPGSGRWRYAVAAAAIVVVPFQPVARSASHQAASMLAVLAPALEAGREQAPPPPTAPPAPPQPVTPARGEQSTPPPQPPAPPAPPEPPAPVSGSAYSWDDGTGEGWAFISGDSQVTMHGPWRNHGHIKRLAGDGKRVFWFERDGREYVIDDAKTLDRIGAMLAPQRELGDQQGVFGGRQGTLGAEQGTLGAKQAELGAQMAELAARQAAFAAEQAKLGLSRSRLDADAGKSVEADLESRERELEAKMEEVGREMEAIGRRMEELGRQQEALGRKQEELGRQQEALGRKQEEAARRVDRELRRLMDDAVKNGTARPVK